jgi:hypothetical protein
MESASFFTSFARKIRKNALVGLILLIVLPVVLVLPRHGHASDLNSVKSWFKNNVTLALLAGCGITPGLAYFLFFTGRFLMCAPKRVVITGDALRLEFRHGKTAQIGWEEIDGASLTSGFSLKWTLSAASSSILLRDQGFSEDDFLGISRLIYARLAARQIQISTDKDGQKCIERVSNPPQLS